MSTITVPLTQGKSTIIDAADWPLIAGKRWNLLYSGRRLYAATWYTGANGRWTCTSLHRILLAAPAGLVVDHINGNGLDNRRLNLRLADPSQNLFNVGKKSHNTSGYKGVTWDRSKGKWQAQINAYGQHYFLGRFTDPIAAACAYDAKCRELHGMFAVLNFPDVSSSD